MCQHEVDAGDNNDNDGDDTDNDKDDDDGGDDEDDDGDDDDPYTPSHPPPPALLSQKLKVKATILPLLLNRQLSQDPTCVLR